jgi:hypothetical protein
MAPNAGYEQTGCAQSMFANRLSWYFDFRSPSKCIDTGAAPLPLCMQNQTSQKSVPCRIML